MVDPDELQALVEALIEEARQRARRRRRRRGAAAALAVFAAAGLYFALDHGGTGTTAAPALRGVNGGSAAAGRTSERWGPAHGPDAGSANAIAVAPSAPHIVYLGTQRGVFRSTNGGRSWVRTGPGQYLIPGVTSLLVDPRSPTTVYAGTNWRWAGGMSYHQRAYRTTDGGRSWRALRLRGEPVAITPTALYAATGGPRGTARLVRSTDGGRSWQPSDGGLPSTYLWGLAFAPSAPATLYAAMGRRGIFASDDGGAHWLDLGVAKRYREVTAIAVDPLHPRTVYAATSASIVGSRDGGQSWRMLNATIREHGRYRWYMQVSALLVDPRDSRTVYATTRCAGVFKSSDGGRRWSAVNDGLLPQCPSTYALAFDPRAPRTIYGADPARGVVKSVDGGAHWAVSDEGLGLATVWSFAVLSGSPRTIYAGAGARGLFNSSDGGAHWRPLATGLAGGAYAVAVDPSDPARVIVGASWARNRFGSLVPGDEIATTADAGRTWTTTSFGGRSVSIVAIRGKTAYAGSDVGDGVYGSSDGGRSWRPLGPPGVIYATALAVDPVDAGVVYVGVMGKTHGLYRSTDGGKSWQRLDALDLDVAAVALDPGDPSTVYVASNDNAGGILESTDGGTTWRQENAGLGRRLLPVRKRWKRPNMMITALAIDPARPTTLYAATDSRGVFRSTDAGTSWHRFNAGLTGRIVTGFALDATGRTVYAATEGGGIVTLRRSS
ncbi:MAG TPA: hypothetical protein VLK36_15845 [Gaiellaceae bacterium]|nr:hypothetical protein [Gaiellaceae bacterium]